MVNLYRMGQAGARFDGKHFFNPIPTAVMQPGAMLKILRESFKPHADRMPNKPPGPFPVDKAKLNIAPENEVLVTWLGHSTVLFSIDGKRFLADPVWYRRASPFTRLGPKRFFEVPLPVSELPPLDFVLLSHNHYDHLDKGTLHYLTTQNIPVITMLGVGRRLRGWGVPDHLITELDWWQQKDLGDGFTVTALPARHFSGRWTNDRFTTLWGSFAIQAPMHNIYFGADSGYYEGFKKIGDTFGPFDLTMLEIGAYNPHWAEIHMGPENAVQAHLDLRGNMLLPLHWGTFALAFHGWTEPIIRLLAEAAKKNVKLLVPAPGETRLLSDGAYLNQWWEK
jgi:L-ascorbate metabolism protein UlaG (beta-lactamase superfamily)